MRRTDRSDRAHPPGRPPSPRAGVIRRPDIRSLRTRRTQSWPTAQRRERWAVAVAVRVAATEAAAPGAATVGRVAALVGRAMMAAEAAG
eukprot:6332168-Prymnesium_polylepis.2